MFKALYSFLASLRSNKKERVEQLHYLYGIKPIEANKYTEECTVTK